MTDLAEEWKPVVDYVGLYEVSSHGQVKSLDRITPDGKHLRGRTMKLHPGSQGRLEVNLTKNGKQKVRRVHQLVMEAFAGPPKPGQEVRHLDGDNTNNRWAPGSTEEEVRAAGGNLIYGTHARNMQDMIDHGRTRRAETECVNGHEYTEANTYWHEGRRMCLECTRTRNRERMRSQYVPRDPSATCGNCGETFNREPGKPRQKFCSPECREAGSWQSRQTWTPAADLTPGDLEHRNALSRVRTRRHRQKKAAGQA